MTHFMLFLCGVWVGAFLLIGFLALLNNAKDN